MKRRALAIAATVAVMFLSAGCQLCDGDPYPLKPAVEACNKRNPPSCHWITP